ILLRQPRADRVHLALRLLNSDSGFQPRKGHGEPATALEHAGTKTPRRPKFGRLPRARCFANVPTKIWRHYTYNCYRITIECDFPTDDPFITAIAPLPKSITNYNDI